MTIALLVALAWAALATAALVYVSERYGMLRHRLALAEWSWHLWKRRAKSMGWPPQVDEDMPPVEETS